MIYVPIGIDCDVVDFLKKYNLRKMSLPFDWSVSYNGVSKCIDCDFKHFTDPLNESRINEQDVYFFHDFHDKNTFILDKEKYNRRCNRLLTILKECETNGEYICFIRKGHLKMHHSEHNGKYNEIKSDIEDAESLNSVLCNKYPQLKYKIIIILGCPNCFNKEIIYKSKFKNIEIHNNFCISDNWNDDNRIKMFDNCLLNALSLNIKDFS
jgi:antitoxin component YwqK of YwqJK toxin-antitoxin module